MPPALLLAALVAVQAPAPPVERPPEASAQLQVGLKSLRTDVWGGDGDHTPTIWTLYLELTVHNTGDEPVILTGGRFVLPLPDGDVQGKQRSGEVEIPPGGTVIVDLERILRDAQRVALVEDVDDPSLRQLRRCSGELTYLVRGQPRNTPFTVSARLRHVFD